MYTDSCKQMREVNPLVCFANEDVCLLDTKTGEVRSGRDSGVPRPFIQEPFLQLGSDQDFYLRGRGGGWGGVPESAWN